MTAFPKRMSAKEFNQAWKSTFGRKGGKYGAVRSEEDGITFRSGLEREYFRELKVRALAGEIRDIQYEPVVRLDVNGVQFNYRPDFTYFDEKLACQVWDECKGEATDRNPVWQKNKKLWLAVGPGPLRIIKGTKRGWTCVQTIWPRAKETR